MNIKQFMARHSDEFGKFDRINNPPSTHRDLCALLILSRFMDPYSDVINSAESKKGNCAGVIVFELPIHEVERMATENQVIQLIRCGVEYNSEYDALVMYL